MPTSCPRDVRRGRHRPALFRALGAADPPEEIAVAGRPYFREEIFKHDSWAATALYEGGGRRLVAKFDRIEPIFGIPVRPFGEWLARREARALERLADVAGVPGLEPTPYCDGAPLTNAVVREFVPGHPLSDREQVTDDFFDRLQAILDAIHAKGIAHADLHKRENILVQEDGAPCLIDFQIHFSGPHGDRARRGISGRLLRMLQATDHYHLLKHRAWNRPDLLGMDIVELKKAYMPWWIRLHRRIARPIRTARRRLLVLLGIRRGRGDADTEHFAEDAVRRRSAA